MANGTAIQLWQCFHCGRQVFESEINSGDGCGCGSKKVRKLSPTFMRVAHYFFRNPGMFKVFLRENVLS